MISSAEGKSQTEQSGKKIQQRVIRDGSPEEASCRHHGSTNHGGFLDANFVCKHSGRYRSDCQDSQWKGNEKANLGVGNAKFFPDDVHHGWNAEKTAVH